MHNLTPIMHNLTPIMHNLTPIMHNLSPFVYYKALKISGFLNKVGTLPDKLGINAS